MKKSGKIGGAVLAAALMLALTACNNGTSPSETSGNSENPASSSDETSLEQPNGVGGEDDAIGETPASDFEFEFDSNTRGMSVKKYIGKDENVIIPRSAKGFNVTKIGGTAFMNCDVASVTLPDTIKKVEMGAFWACFALKSIIVPDGVKGIEQYAFEGCSAEVYYNGKTYAEFDYDELYKLFE